MTRLRVLHLVDDTTAGGVMRVVDHLLTSPVLQQAADHGTLHVTRGKIMGRRQKADVIVSHLAVSWRSLPMLGMLRALNPKTRLIHVEHSYTPAFVAANVPNLKRFETLLRLTYALFDRVIAVSHAQGDWLLDRGAVGADRLKVIQSCVDLARFRQLAPPTPSARVFGAIGRLDRQKGFDTLIEAFRRTTLPGISLRIFGEGPQEAALRQLAGDDPRIQFAGYVADPVAAMDSVDAVAMPSNWEAYGLVALESLAARRKLMINPIDGLTDHICGGAIPVADPSPDGWCHAIENAAADQLPQSRRLLQADLLPEQVFSDKWTALLKALA